MTADRTGLRLVSSCRGTIAHVLVCLPAGFLEQSPEAAVAIVRASRGVPRLSVVTHARSAATVDALCEVEGRPAEVSAVPDGVALSVWVQDQALAFETDDPEGRPGLLCGPRFAVGNLAVVPAAAGAPVLDGGNILCGDGFVLVGSDEWERWRAARVPAPPDVPDAARAAFAADYHAPERVIVVGGSAPSAAPAGWTDRRPDGPWRQDPWPGIVQAGSRQAVFHIDVFLSLAGPGADGRERILVGDVRLAAAIAGGEAPDPAYADRFDGAARLLEAEGFAVIRNPLPVVGTDHAHRRRRTMHLLSANNAWVEATGVARTVAWLPVFAAGPDDPQARVDAAMAALWAGLGFEVRPVDGLGALALRNGGLNCASRVLSRRVEGG